MAKEGEKSLIRVTNEVTRAGQLQKGFPCKSWKPRTILETKVILNLNGYKNAAHRADVNSRCSGGSKLSSSEPGVALSMLFASGRRYFVIEEM